MLKEPGCPLLVCYTGGLQLTTTGCDRKDGESYASEQAIKAWARVRQMCQKMDRQGLVLGFDGGDVDVHIHVTGAKTSYLGLAMVVGTLALAMGKDVDPSACFLGLGGSD